MTTSTFSYAAVSSNGNTTHGRIQAVDAEQAHELLVRDGLHPFKIISNDETESSSNFKLGFASSSVKKLKQREEFYRRSSVLLGAGISIDRVMRMLGDDRAAKSKNLIAAGIEKDISTGKSFSSAVAVMLPDATAIELASLQISEKTGKLADTLLSLANQLESQLELRARVGSMLVYPMFLMALVPLVLIFVAAVLVPNIAPLFENSGKPIPVLLAFFVNMSQLLQAYPASMLGALVLALIGVVLSFQNAEMKRGLDRLVFRLPILSSLQQQQQQQAFCQGMGTLLANGATLQDALAAIAVSHSKSNMKQVQDDVNEGGKLSTTLLERKVLNLESSQVIAVGEESNQLPSMFFHVAATIQKDYAARLERLMTLLVPVLTLFIGLVVGGVMVSVMSALLAVNEVPL